jgi:hypothetical protein
MRGQMTHLDTDVLAEFRAGLITGRRGVKIAAHLAGCDRCTALDDKLAGVSVLLASVPAPPMPDSVAQRLDTVLAAEVTRKNYPERGQVDRPGESGAPDRPGAKRGFRLATWRVLVPVGAAAVLLAGGGYGLSRIVGGPGSPQSFSAAAGSASSAAASSAARSASRAGPPAAAPLSPGPSVSPAPSARSQLKSGKRTVNVSPATLRQFVEAELRLPPAARPTKATSPQILGCIHLLAGSAPLELVQSARFQGQQATVIVAHTGQGDTVWVAGPACSAASRDVLATITLPSGISGP